MRPKPRRGFTSIKENSGLKKEKKLSGKANVGQLIRKYPDVQEYLFTLMTNSDMVYEDMDFSIEEFSDIAGADLDDMLTEISEIIRYR